MAWTKPPNDVKNALLHKYYARASEKKCCPQIFYVNSAKMEFNGYIGHAA